MAKGTRTGVWEVYFKGVGNSSQEKLISCGKMVLPKASTLCELKEIAKEFSQFTSENDDWVLCCFDNGNGYAKFDDDFYDPEKSTFMQLNCYWLDEDEPLKMEWPNHRKYIVNKMNETVDRLQSLAKQISSMEDNDCYQEYKLKCIRILMECPELNISDVIKSLDADLERIDDIEIRLAKEIPFDIDLVLDQELAITAEIIEDGGVLEDDNPITLALSDIIDQRIDIYACDEAEEIRFSIRKRGVVGSINMTSCLSDWLYLYYEDKASPVTMDIYRDDQSSIWAGIKE